MDIKDRLYKVKESIVERYNKLDKQSYKTFLEKNLKWLVTVVIIIFLGLGYYIGNVTTTKSQVLKELNIALKEGNTRKLTKIIEVNNESVDKEEIEPLAEYFKGKDEVVNNTINKISRDNKTEIFELISKKGLFKDKYYINLKTFNITLNSNFKNAQIYINENDKYRPNDTIRNLIPGNYKIIGEVKSDYGNIKTEKDITLMKDENVNINLSAVMVTVSSNVKDASVIINGKDSDILVKNFKDIGPMPSDGTVKISLRKEFPWGTIDSKEVEVKDNKNININIDIANDKLWDEAQNAVNKFYKSVINALNNEDKSLIESSTEKAKDKIYGILEKNYFIFKNQYDMTSLNIDKEKSHFEYNNGDYKGTVVCDINYDVSMKLFGFLKDENSKSFFTKLIYKDNEWIVDDVENFSL